MKKGPLTSSTLRRPARLAAKEEKRPVAAEAGARATHRLLGAGRQRSTRRRAAKVTKKVSSTPQKKARMLAFFRFFPRPFIATDRLPSGEIAPFFCSPIFRKG